MNAALTWLAAKPAWAIDLAIWSVIPGIAIATLIRSWEILADDDTPIPAPVPAVPAVPVALDLGPFPIDLDAWELTP